MTIPLSRLAERIKSENIQSISVRSQEDEPVWDDLPLHEINSLIDFGYIHGVGSRKRIRFLRLDIPLDELEEKRQRHYREFAHERPHNSLDFLSLMMSSRKFTYRERIDVWRDDNMHACFIHQHKGMRLG